MTDPTEHLRLVKRAIRGNPDAYGQLIAGQQEYLYKMAFLYMKNKEDALDLVGSTVLKGYQNIHRLKNPEWFRTWLTRILINLARDELKKAVHHSDITELRFRRPPQECPPRRNAIWILRSESCRTNTGLLWS